MTADPITRILTKPFPAKYLILVGFLAVYVAITFAIFFKAVVPSYVEGTTSEMFAVDSTVYVYMADSLREGRNEPLVIGALYSFPNTLWTPVFISFIFHNTFLVMLANYAIFTISILLLKKSYSISSGLFIFLLLLNPTTTTSILCVNKEVLDLFSLALFLYSRVTQRKWLLFAAMALSILNRWELCVVMIAFMIAGSRLNPWRKKRVVTVIILTLAINFVMPFLGAKVLANRFAEAEPGNSIAFLDSLQMHYLYVLAVIPKIGQNLFGYLLNPFAWGVGSSWTYIMIFNNASYAVLIFTAAKKRLLKLRNNFVYLGAIGSVIIAQSLVPQPRYFYFLYVLLSLQIAQIGASKIISGGSNQERSIIGSHAFLLDRRGVDFA